MIIMGGLGQSGVSTLNALLDAHESFVTSQFETCFVVVGGGLRDVTRAISDDYSSMRLDDALARFERLMTTDLCSPRSYPFNQLNISTVFGVEGYQRRVRRYFAQIGCRKYEGDGLTIEPRIRVGSLSGPYKFKRLRLPWWIGRSRKHLFMAPRLSREAAVAAARDLVAGLYNERRKIVGGLVWCDQTSNNLLDADFWVEMFPEALYVQVVRNPWDVALAHRGQSWGPSDFRLTCTMIRDNYQRWTEVRNTIAPTSYLELRFEEMVSNPDAAVALVCARVGLEPPDPPTARLWSAPAVNARVGVFSDADIAAYTEILGPVARALGYPVPVAP